MNKKIYWVIFNIIMVVMAVVLNNTIYYLISILSNAFLFDKFEEVFIAFVKQEVTFKEMYKVYFKYETPSPKPLMITLQLFFGIKFILETILKHKANYNGLLQSPVDIVTIVVGIVLLNYMVRNVRKFDGSVVL